MIGKVYKVTRPNADVGYVAIFPQGDYFFDIGYTFRSLYDILNGDYLNAPGNYVGYVRTLKYRLKYIGSTTAFITEDPELFI